ncbi:hypothetical protein BURPS1710b_3452 [Burkholderia pseudomallei 1710b]|uniref:Uncharacterized protein n=1 Tax=Burkholderia pseudomallei (strain 1710b) TaxID=320372 RepID=Q3JNN0_BURP1|nr:hypothetical protein BURPS1710b_3452 [Burkholderia pseudomallei 1710b]
MRHDRIQHAQQHAVSLAQHGGRRALRAFDRVEHLHRGRHDRVVLQALIIEIRLLEHAVDLAAQRLVRLGELRGVERRAHGQRFAVREAERPHAAQKAARAVDARAGPLELLLGRRREHREKARGVGAVMVDQHLRIDAVVLRLRHLLDAAELDRLPVRFQHRADGAALVVERHGHVGRVVPGLLARRVLAVERLVEHHPLREQVLRRFAERDETEIAHHLRPEARVQQVQDRVLDAADVLIHRHPVVGARIDHRLRVGRRVAREVPRGIDERVHRVRFALRGRAALRARAVQERVGLRERVARAVRHEILRQHDGQVLLRHRHVAARRAVDDRDRRAPVALARDAPVTQSVGDLLVAEAARLQLGRDRVDGRVVREAVVLAAVHAHGARLVAVPFLPRVGRVRLALHGNHLPDRQAILLREREVALVVRGHAHHRALAVAHQHVVADPHLDGLARERMRHRKARGDALLLHRRDVGLGDAAALAFVDERLQRGLVPREPRGERMLGRDRAERDAHDRVGARREHAQQLLLAVELVRKAEVHAEALADPVVLHHLHALGPTEAVEIVQQLVRVLRDPHVVHRDLALFDERARAPAAPVDHLLVREHGLVDRVPVHGARLLVRDALLEHLQEQPLVPLVVVGLAGRDLARPVDREAHRLHLLLHVSDVLVRPLRGRHAVGHRGVLGRHPECVPTHRHQRVIAVHPQIAVHHVVDRVVAHVTHVQLAGRVRQHRHAVELLAVRVFLRAVGIGCAPVALGGGFDVGGYVSFVHGVVRAGLLSGARRKVPSARALEWIESRASPAAGGGAGKTSIIPSAPAGHAVRAAANRRSARRGGRRRRRRWLRLRLGRRRRRKRRRCAARRRRPGRRRGRVGDEADPRDARLLRGAHHLRDRVVAGVARGAQMQLRVLACRHHVAQPRGERVGRDRRVVPVQLARRVDRHRDRLRRLARGRGRDLRQIEPDRMRQERRGDDEDDEQHEHHVDERRHVDVRHRLRRVLVIESAECHAALLAGCIGSTQPARPRWPHRRPRRRPARRRRTRADRARSRRAPRRAGARAARGCCTRAPPESRRPGRTRS